MNRTLSVKARVTVWFAVFLVVLTGLNLAVLLVSARSSADESADALLKNAISRAERAVVLKDGEIYIDSDLDYMRDGIYLAFFDADGRPLYGRVPSAEAVDDPFASDKLHTVESESGRWYLRDHYTALSETQGVWIRSSMLANSSDNVLAGMTRLSLIALPGLALAALLGGYFLISRAIRPAEKLVETAQQITDGNDLDRRIALQNGAKELLALANAFDGMFERLQKSFEREVRFTADASHELRTPVAVALTSCEYALEHAQTEEELRDALQTVREKLHLMSALISRLLALSRADRGQMTLQTETVSLSLLMEAVAQQTAELAAEKKITVETEIEEGISVQGDETLLMQMLLNLAENACKYGREGGWIRLTLKRDGERTVGTVEDNGIGMTEEQQAHIFERFYRADKARTGEAGFGLGLPTVQYILKAHGGTIDVQSVCGEGSVFRFVL